MFIIRLHVEFPWFIDLIIIILNVRTLYMDAGTLMALYEQTLNKGSDVSWGVVV